MPQTSFAYTICTFCFRNIDYEIFKGNFFPFPIHNLCAHTHLHKMEFLLPNTHHVIISREFSSCIFISYAHIWTCRRKNFPIPLCIITWSALGRPNKVACTARAFRGIFISQNWWGGERKKRTMVFPSPLPWWKHYDSLNIGPYGLRHFHYKLKLKRYP